MSSYAFVGALFLSAFFWSHNQNNNLPWYDIFSAEFSQGIMNRCTECVSLYERCFSFSRRLLSSPCRSFSQSPPRFLAHGSLDLYCNRSSERPFELPYARVCYSSKSLLLVFRQIQNESYRSAGPPRATTCTNFDNFISSRPALPTNVMPGRVYVVL